MKRSSDTSTSLVYAYGCGEPLDGLEAAMKEDARVRALWDRLVGIDREYERRILAAACADDERLAAIVAELEHRRAMPRVLDDDWPAERKLRRDLDAQTWRLLATWRRAHQDAMREHETWRREQVVIARRESDCYWCNYNAVIQRYETARREVRSRGRALRPHDQTRDDGCLTVQIQRTCSGLGAAPAELHDGSVSSLHIAPVPAAAHDPATFRGERRRLCRTTVRMRVDAAGNTVTLPVWLHRPLPADARIKLAQLTWRSQCGGRRTWRVCLTVSRPRAEIWHPRAHALGLVRIDIAEHGTGLRVATIHGCSTRENVVLDAHWLAMMDRVDHLASVIGDEAAGDHARIRARLERPGLWRRLLLRRREMYRLIARDVARECGSIVIETPALSEAAWLDRGKEAGKLRHLACAHELIAELRHQAAKHDAQVEVHVAAASAPVPRRVRRKREADQQAA